MNPPKPKPSQSKKDGRGHPRTVTLKELAAHLGLSQTTISRVISQTATASRIPKETQERVLKAAAELNYQPNVYASGLRKKRSFTVGVMVPEISEGYSTSVLGGIEDALLQEGYFYFVVSHRHRADLLEKYPNLLLSRAVEGLIAVDTPVKTAMPVPIVAVSGHKHGNGIITIELNHEVAARDALGHLYELGHRRIAFIKGQSFSSDTRSRWNAICKTAAEMGLKIDPQLTVQLEGVNPGSEPGYFATRKLLNQSKNFTAIFAFNDITAIGAIQALAEVGLRVPHHVSVIGFDDIPSAVTNNPSLTTVHQPLREMGKTAAATLLRAIQGTRSEKESDALMVLPTFIPRQSTSTAIKA